MLTLRPLYVRTSHNGNSRKFVRMADRRVPKAWLLAMIPSRTAPVLEGGYGQGDSPLVGKSCDHYSGFVPGGLAHLKALFVPSYIRPCVVAL